VPGDWNGFFGLFTNVLLNVIVLTTLCLYGPHAHTVYGRLPAGDSAAGQLVHAYLAWQLGTRAFRSAMPYGPRAAHVHQVLVIMPRLSTDQDPVLAQRLAWCFIIGVIVLLGAFIGPWIRKMTPRAAMLGTLAGISIAFISMRPAFQMWEVPWIAFACFAIVLITWTANIRLPGGVPGGLAAVIVGAVLGWAAAPSAERLHEGDG
jgi:AGZA family xanthine/uracil permease-like MFS transporter